MLAAIVCAMRFLLPLYRHIKRIYAWPRLRVVMLTCCIFILLFLLTWQTSRWILVARLLFVGFAGLTVFGIVEVWPKRLPAWCARWALQVVMVAVIVPIAVVLGYHLTTLNLDPPWWRDGSRIEGAFTFTFLGMLIGSWMAVAALLKQIKQEALKQALQFELERSEFERRALNARLTLLQAQVEPHFLFNTLANIRELVVMGSPQAAKLLENLIAYLRAAVPQISERNSSVANEMERVRVYLEIMHLRMPDRLQFSLAMTPDVGAIQCPPVSILTLVENAVRHGIDPSEQGGRIDVRVFKNVIKHEQWIEVEVVDTGVGLVKINNIGEDVTGLGTGIANLRERMRLAYGDDVMVTLMPQMAHGARAVMRWRVDQ